MSGWIGTLGALSEVLWKVSLSESTPARFAFQQAAGKRWAFLASPTPRRSWSVEVKGTQEDTRALTQFAHTSAEPLVWVSEHAALTNVLTPPQSLLVGVSNAGAMVTSDGSIAPASVAAPTRLVVAERVPVHPGKPFSAAVEVSGLRAVLGVQFYNTAGRVVGDLMTATTNSESAQRLVVTISEVPATAAWATLTVGGGRFTRPSAAWTKTAAPWDVGMGATAVVVDGVETTFDDVHHATGAVWRSVSAKIEEVG